MKFIIQIQVVINFKNFLTNLSHTFEFIETIFMIIRYLIKI